MRSTAIKFNLLLSFRAKIYTKLTITGALPCLNISDQYMMATMNTTSVCQGSKHGCSNLTFTVAGYS